MLDPIFSLGKSKATVKMDDLHNTQFSVPSPPVRVRQDGAVSSGGLHPTVRRALLIFLVPVFGFLVSACAISETKLNADVVTNNQEEPIVVTNERWSKTVAGDPRSVIVKLIEYTAVSPRPNADAWEGIFGGTFEPDVGFKYPSTSIQYAKVSCFIASGDFRPEVWQSLCPSEKLHISYVVDTKILPSTRNSGEKTDITQSSEPLRQMTLQDLKALATRYGLNFESTDTLVKPYTGHIKPPISSANLIARHGRGYIFTSVETLPPPGREPLVSGFAYFEAVDK